MIIIIVSLLLVACASSIASILYLRSKMKRSVTLSYKVDETIGINILESLTLGGVEQWFHIRGRDKKNPILLFLHGGPGLSQIGWFDEIQRPWEDYFTVVQWDQRQAGKSYAPLASLGETVTNRQMIEDAEEMVGYLRQRFQREKIIIVGKSYGSYLGMHIVKRKPEWIYAYVGDGQMVNTKSYIQNEYQHLVDYAKSSKNHELVAKLEAMAPRIDPSNQWGSFVEYEHVVWEELNKIGKGISRTLSTEELFGNFALKKYFSPHLSLSDLKNLRFGDPYVLLSSAFKFSEEFMSIDLPAEIGSAFEVPIFVFTGAHDWHVPRSLQSEWFESIEAPYKEQIIFEKSSHFPYLEEPGRYLMTLATKVNFFTNSERGDYYHK